MAPGRTVRQGWKPVPTGLLRIPVVVGQVGQPSAPATTTSGTGAVTVTGAWSASQPCNAGDLLVARVTAYGTTSASATTQTAGQGWAKVAENTTETHTCSAIWIKIAAGSDAAPAFKSTIAGTSADTRLTCYLTELTNADPWAWIDYANGVGTTGVGNATSLTVTSPGVVPFHGSYALDVACQGYSTSGTKTWSASTGWSQVTDNASTFAHSAYDDYVGPAAGAAVSDTIGWGSGTITSASACMIVVCPLGQRSSAPCIVAWTGGTSSAYYVDQYNNPRFLLADAIWPVIYAAGSASTVETWYSVMTQLVSVRASQGYTGFEFNMLPTTEYGGTAGQTWDGVAPFTSGGDPTTGMNNAYWARLDYLLTLCGEYGITCYFNLLMGEDLSAGMAGSWTNAQFQAYGAAVASRYLRPINNIWMMGDDGGQGTTGPTNIMIGVRSTGDTGLVGVENVTETTSRYGLKLNDVQPWVASGDIGYNWCYSYNCSYLAIEYAYTESSPIPVLRGDGLYYATLGNGFDDIVMRNHLWWTLASGGRGFSGGSFDGGWSYFTPSTINETYTGSSTGSWQDYMYLVAEEFGGPGGYSQFVVSAVTKYFTSLPQWWTLMPDTSSTFITAGRGTRAAAFTENLGSGTAYTGATADTYVAGSINPAGTLALLYFSNGVSTTVTLNTVRMGTITTALWVDPANCATSSAGIATTYTKPSGTNSAGDHDWVLVLQGTGAGPLAPVAPAYTKPVRKGWKPVPTQLLAVPQTAGGVSANVTGVAAAVTVQGGAGTVAGGGNVTGAGAAVTVQGAAGVPSGGGAVTGTGAAVTVQGGLGAASGAAAVTGTGAAVTVQGGAGTVAGGGNVTGTGAAVTVQGGIGVPFGGTSGAANVTGAGAAVTVQGGTGAASGGGAVTGVAAAVTVQAGAGTTSGAANVAGAAAAVPVQAGAGTPAGSAGVTGTGAVVTVQGGTGVPSGGTSGAANVTGVAAAVTVQGAAGSLSAAAHITGLAALITVLGGTGAASSFTVGALTAATAPASALTAADTRTGGPS